MRNVLVMAFLVASAGLAGCTGAGSDDPISISNVEGTTYKFTANVEADEYKWDLGDRLTTLTGRSVEHTYDFTDGTLAIRLTTTTGGKISDYDSTLVLGSGNNSAPSLILEASTNWTIPGETIRLSGASSTDADGDNFRYQWNCIRSDNAVRKAPHVHEGGFEGGAEYGTASISSGISRVAIEPIAEPNRVVEGDLCDGLAANPGSSLDGVIEGSFEQTGVYNIVMIMTDGPNPTKSTAMTIWVTNPAERPDPIFSATYSGNFTAGLGGTLQENLAEQTGTDFDSASFSVKLINRVPSLTGELTCSGQAHNGCTITLFDGAVPKCTGDSSTTMECGQLDPGSYAVEVILEGGAQVTWQADFNAEYVMYPGIYY